jgi:hypothetical protein
LKRFRSGIGHKPSVAAALQCEFPCRTASQSGPRRSFGFYDDDDTPTT